MRPLTRISTVALASLLSSCTPRGENPVDPYEALNRKTHKFNMAVDKAVLKPAATIYTTVLPRMVRKGIDNVFNNFDMVPTVANDILQAERKWFIKDTWRLVINSLVGIGGVFDVAEKWGLPAHYNDLGLTFAKWGDKHSPYFVIPLIGPATVRDGFGMLYQFTIWTPYFYFNSVPLAYGLAGTRYVDLRAQLTDSERIINEALDQYSFIRDAYLQHRNYLIQGNEQDNGELYLEDDKADKTAIGDLEKAKNNETPSDYVDE